MISGAREVFAAPVSLATPSTTLVKNPEWTRCYTDINEIYM